MGMEREVGGNDVSHILHKERLSFATIMDVLLDTYKMPTNSNTQHANIKATSQKVALCNGNDISIKRGSPL